MVPAASPAAAGKSSGGMGPMGTIDELSDPGETSQEAASSSVDSSPANLREAEQSARAVCIIAEEAAVTAMEAAMLARSAADFCAGWS